jgi:hypothetical protein
MAVRDWETLFCLLLIDFSTNLSTTNSATYDYNVLKGPDNNDTWCLESGIVNYWNGITIDQY